MGLPTAPGVGKPQDPNEDPFEDVAPEVDGGLGAGGVPLTPALQDNDFDDDDEWATPAAPVPPRAPSAPSAASAAPLTPSVPAAPLSHDPVASTPLAPAVDDDDEWGDTVHEQHAVNDAPFLAPKQEGGFRLPSVDEVLARQRGEQLEGEEGAHDAPAAQVPQFPQYISVGQLTSEQLINAKSDQFAPLADKIADVVAAVQARLTQDDKIEDVIAARAGGTGSEKYNEMARLLDRHILEFMSTRRDMPHGEQRKILVAAAINEVLGLGPLEPLWRDPSITEIMCNGPFDVQVEIRGKIIRVPGARFRDQKHLTELCQQILSTIGRRIDIQHPIEDGRLVDGSRVHVVHSAIAPAGPNLTIRRHREEAWTIKELVDRGAMSEGMVTDLGFWINSGCSGIVIGGTGSGKLLAASTKIPTPTGMTTMGDLRAGDLVLDEHGQPTTVTAKYRHKEVPVPYRLTFSDGTSVIADEDHNWVTVTAAARARGEAGSVVTTKEIAESLLLPTGAPNHAVPVVSRPVAYAPRRDDCDKTPFEVGLSLSKAAKYSDDFPALPPRVPERYLYGTVEEREELLCGLLQEHSAVASSGEIMFPSTHLAFTEDVRTLIHSLGYQSTFDTRRIVIDTSSGPCEVQTHVVTFVARPEVFKDPERAERYRHIVAVARMNRAIPEDLNVRYITSVEPVECDEEMFCITVDSPSHMYLCTEAFIPTHNTTVLNAVSGLIPFDQRIVTIEDSLELKIHPDRLAAAPMEARPESASGRGGVTIRHLVKASLRMRPDWIIVGEVRDASAFDMLTALNTGHSGLTTVHANGASEAVPRLESLVAQAGELDPKGILGLIAGSVDLFIVVDRFPEDGSRRVTGVYEVPSRVESDASGQLTLEPIPLWEFVHDSTDPKTGEVKGHYEKRNDPSPILVRKHRLDRRTPLTLEQVYELSS